jgi:FlaA1/EpsC-like NDP-sugar epimerase
MGIKIISTEHLEKKIISKSNRFKLTETQIKEIHKKFKNSNILILGAAGSIGSKFVLEFLNIKFHKIYLFDKDENELTELNRAVNTKKKKTQNIQYVCGDVVNFNFKKFITENKINHVLNFAAIKHVRSEENKYSLNYMFETNCLKFLIFKYPKFLKSVFSISTDKVIKPTSMLGVSKKIMEHAMAEIKKKNPKIIVSSVRFTNVSFSKGSILESIYKKILSKTVVGVPKNVDRYFITHEEAVSLCLKSFLSQSKNYIIQPSEYFTNLPLNIKDLSIKIFQSMKVKLITKGKNKNIIFQGKISQGQKNVEDLKEDQETYLKFDTDPTIEKTKFLPVKNIDIIFSKIIKIQDKIKFINLAKKIYPKFTNDKKKIKISSVI